MYLRVGFINILVQQNQAYFLKTLLEEIIGKCHDVKISAWVDHKGAVQSINSTNSMIDKRLRINAAAIRQMLERKEVSTISHCPGKDQHIPAEEKYLHYDALDENYQKIEIEICASTTIYPLK